MAVGEMHRRPVGSRVERVSDVQRRESRFERLQALFGFLFAFLPFLWTCWCNVWKWFKADMLMYVNGKAYKPTDPEVAGHVVSELRKLLSGPNNWTFVDLGCGLGDILPAMRAAKSAAAGMPMFEHVVGVELDEDTYRDAVKRLDSSIEVVCGDMFAYVEKVCMANELFGGRAVFYMYEPLWKANMAAEVMDGLYGGLLTAVSAHPGSVVVYVTGIQHHTRHISTTMLQSKGLVLLHSSRVNQSGVANSISGTYNTLEIWRVEVQDDKKENAKAENQ